jgi:hypothetical protein
MEAGMRIARTMLVATAAALLAAGASAHEVGVDRDAMQRRFQTMDDMMERTHGMRGPERHRMMREHMDMMDEQMGAMHGMYGGHGDRTMGPGTSGPGTSSPGMSSQTMNGQMGPGMMQRLGGAPGPQDGEVRPQMQERMDAMQRMMEQMLEQQKLMMGDEAQ